MDKSYEDKLPGKVDEMGVSLWPTPKKLSTPSSNVEEMKNGGDDGTRTRDLCRDRAAF
jgi:hypothetical protein